MNGYDFNYGIDNNQPVLDEIFKLTDIEVL